MIAQDTTTSDEALPLGQQARKKAASSGQAMPNGDYPIRNEKELKSAITLSGRSKTYSKAQVKSHIVKRARALGLTDVLPDDWKSDSVSQEEIVATLTLEQVGGHPVIIQDSTASTDGAMTIKVPFYVGGSLARAPGFSQQIYFPSESLPRLIQEGNSQIGEAKQPLTVYARHNSALKADALPVGNVTALEQEDRIGYAVIKVVPTSDGKDVQTLIRHKALNAVSMRTERYQLGRGKVNGKQVLVFETGSLLDGIDFAPDSPAQPTYGIEVLAQEVRVEPAGTNRRRNLSEPSITLEDVPMDVAEQIAKPLKTEIADLKAEVKTLRQEKDLRDRDDYLRSIADRTVKPDEAFTALVTLCNEKSATSKEAASPVVTPFLLQALEDARTEKPEPKKTTAEVVRDLFVTRTPSGSGVVSTTEAKPALSQEAETHPLDVTAGGLSVPEDF